MSQFKWVERAKKVERIHKSYLADDSTWTLAKTAKLLERSIGKVSEDLMLAEWIKKNPRVERIRVIQDALDFVRQLKREEKLK